MWVDGAGVGGESDIAPLPPPLRTLFVELNSQLGIPGSCCNPLTALARRCARPAAEGLDCSPGVSIIIDGLCSLEGSSESGRGEPGGGKQYLEGFVGVIGDTGRPRPVFIG